MRITNRSLTRAARNGAATVRERSLIKAQYHAVKDLGAAQRAFQRAGRGYSSAHYVERGLTLVSSTVGAETYREGHAGGGGRPGEEVGQRHGLSRQNGHREHVRER